MYLMSVANFCESEMSQLCTVTTCKGTPASLATQNCLANLESFFFSLRTDLRLVPSHVFLALEELQ